MKDFLVIAVKVKYILTNNVLVSSYFRKSALSFIESINVTSVGIILHYFLNPHGGSLY